MTSPRSITTVATAFVVLVLAPGAGDPGLFEPGLLSLGAPSARADDDDDDDDRPRRYYRELPRRYYRERPRPAPQRPVRVAAAAVGAIPAEWVIGGVTPGDLARLQEGGFTIVAERRLGLVPEVTVRVRAPRNLSEAGADQTLRTLVPNATRDRNHLYRPSAASCRPETCFPLLPASAAAPRCASAGRVGLIDTAVDPGHPALAGFAIERRTSRSPGREPSSPEHGTEVAIRLTSSLRPSPGLQIVAVDAFHARRGGDSADAFDIAAALDQLSAGGAAIVNMSLAGPTNGLLDRIGREATRRGMIVVAAAGNDGAGAPPRYPAAYDWAVAVTAVGPDGRVFPRAVRGPHIAFAAPGVRVQMPDARLQPGPLRSGTSYAAPSVTAHLLARGAGTAKPESRREVLEAAATAAQDLGAPGRDPVFGFGLIANADACGPESKGAAVGGGAVLR